MGDENDIGVVFLLCREKGAREKRKNSKRLPDGHIATTITTKMISFLFTLLDNISSLTVKIFLQRRWHSSERQIRPRISIIFCQRRTHHPFSDGNNAVEWRSRTNERTSFSSHPIYPRASPEITTRTYNPIYPHYWQKSSDNYATRSRDYHCATYTYLGPEWFKAPPKHYATYKEPLHQAETTAPVRHCRTFFYDFSSLAVGKPAEIRPESRFVILFRRMVETELRRVPSHSSGKNDDWARGFNDYPGRFRIEYASPDDVNDLCFKNNHVQYDTSVTHRQSRYAVRLHCLSSSDSSRSSRLVSNG